MCPILKIVKSAKALHPILYTVQDHIYSSFFVFISLPFLYHLSSSPFSSILHSFFISLPHLFVYLPLLLSLLLLILIPTRILKHFFM